MLPYLDAGRATLPEIKAFIEKYPVAIVPLGSTEQHGPHLPLNTDNLIAERMALETARRSAGLVMPNSAVGYAWVWRGIPGTMTLRFDTYMAYVRDITESLADWGVKAIYFMSGHGSNPQPTKHALRELIVDKIDIKVLYGLYEGIGQMQAEMDSKPWHKDLHAEEIETSLMLEIAPDLVRMDKAAPDYPPVPADYGQSEKSMGTIIGSGVFGDPTRATREKGKRWIDLAADRSAKLWLDYLDENGILKRSDLPK